MHRGRPFILETVRDEDGGGSGSGSGSRVSIQHRGSLLLPTLLPDVDDVRLAVDAILHQTPEDLRLGPYR